MKTERLDPLQRIFVALENKINVNTHQIVVLAGELQLTRLRAALSRTVGEFALCTSRIDEGGATILAKHWSPDDVPLHQVPFSGPICLSNPTLRHALMRLSQWSSLRWQRCPPVQVFYLTGEGSSRSALMINSHHGLADAKADAQLLERLLRNYGALAGDPEDVPPVEWPCVSYAEIRRRMGAEVSPLREALRGLGEAVRDVRVRTVGFGATRTQRETDEIDFAYRPMDAATEGRVRAIARQSGQTVNTVLTAALYAVLQRSRPRSSKRIKILCPVSLRPLLDASSRDAFQNLMVPCALTLEPRYESTQALFAAIADRVSEIRRGQIFAFGSRLAALQPLATVARNSAILPWLMRVFAGSNACYSNPGIVTERLESFGASGPRVTEYCAFGCVIPPYDFILYTPQFRGRLYLNAIYRKNAFADVESDLIAPIEAAVVEMADELGVAADESAAARTAEAEAVSSCAAGA